MRQKMDGDMDKMTASQWRRESDSPMEEDERLFPENDKGSVTQFQKFRQCHEPAPKGSCRIMILPIIRTKWKWQGLIY